MFPLNLPNQQKVTVVQTLSTAWEGNNPLKYKHILKS